MTHAHFYFPRSRIGLHHDSSCSYIRMNDKAGQRVIALAPSSLSTNLALFVGKQVPFNATADLNDLWVALDFADSQFELALMNYIRRLLAQRYSGWTHATVDEHC